MTHDQNPLSPSSEQALRDEAQALRREAPTALHAAIMARVAAERVGAQTEHAQTERAQTERVNAARRQLASVGATHEPVVASRPVRRLSWRQRCALPAAAAAVVLLAAWGSQQWVQSKRAELAPVSMHVLQEVTAAPARAVRKLTDAPSLRAAGRELRGTVAEEFDGLGARASALGWALARRLGGPLSKLGRALH